MSKQNQTTVSNRPSIGPSLLKTPKVATLHQRYLTSPVSSILLAYHNYAQNKPLYDSILEHLDVRIPTLQPDKHYTLKKICDKGFWFQLEKGERIEAGIFIAYLVARNNLGLHFGGKTKSNSQIYYVN